MPTLYFISHFSHSAYFNMAFDEWLFEKSIENPENIYLRLYSWSDQGGITFGLNQKTERAVDLTKTDGLPVIRRITGGRAIYHDPSELTYSVALNSALLDSKAEQSISKSSEKIAELLVLFLQKAGIKSHYVRKSAEENSKPDFFHSKPCFDSFAKYELSAENRKVIASAQRRYQNFLLQHGSIKLNGPLFHAALQTTGDNDKMTNALEPVIESNFLGFADCFKDAASQYFNCHVKTLPITSVEREEVSYIEKEVKKNTLKKRDIIKQKSS